MNKKTIAIILEIIPILSAVVSFIFLLIPYGSTTISKIIPITFLIAFLGVVFFFIGKKLCKEKIVKILGIIDIVTTISIVVVYIIAIFTFGL